MACRTETRLEARIEARIEQLERQLAAARGSARWLDGTHTAAISASGKLAGVDAMVGDAKAAIHASLTAEVTANKASHAVRLVADDQGARSETENTAARSDATAARPR
jgi:hypothetical protein